MTFIQRYAVAWGIVFVAFGSYLLVGDVGATRPHVDLMTPLDSAIAFQPWTVWLYLGLFIGVFHFGVWYVRDRHHYLQMCKSMLLAAVVAFVAFVLTPASYPRPTISGDGINLAILSALYELDPPNNTFPSLHVAYMVLTALGVWRYDRRVGPYVFGVAMLPAIAILTTKQHFVADFFGGAALALVCHLVVFGTVISAERSRLPAA